MIVASTPAFVAVFAWIFLKERCGPFQLATMAVTLVGVAIVMQPPFIFDIGSDTVTKSQYFV